MAVGCIARVDNVMSHRAGGSFVLIVRGCTHAVRYLIDKRFCQHLTMLCLLAEHHRHQGGTHDTDVHMHVKRHMFIDIPSSLWAAAQADAKMATRAAQSRQKAYADKPRKEMELQVGDPERC